jgi:hypothetical protein
MDSLYLIDEALRVARYELTLWNEEYTVHGPKGTRRSNMNAGDLRWLRARISKLEALRRSVEDQVSAIMAEITARHV